MIHVEDGSCDAFDVKPDLAVVMSDHLHVYTFDVAFDLCASGHYSLGGLLTSANSMSGRRLSLMRLMVRTTGTHMIGNSSNRSYIIM